MSSLWQQLLLSGGVWVVIGVVLTAVFARAKTGAETDEIVAKTRAAVLISLHTELDEALDLSETRRKRINRLEALIEEHTRWDRIVLQALREHDIDGIPDPPTLEHD